MKKSLSNFCKCFVALGGCLLVGNPAVAEQAPNPRAAADQASAPVARASGRSVSRGSGDSKNVVNVGTDKSQTVVSRAATNRTPSVVSRSATQSPTNARTVNRSATVSPARTSASVSRSSVATPSANVSSARSATTVARGAATQNRTVNTSRSATTARATAVFDDVSKISTGYAGCREAYATCMDQFCAKANDTYRRCFCSDKFSEFRDFEYALDEAKELLMSFEDNNLNAVDKTADEVDAMYSATAGENAIRRDTSDATKKLNEISDLLSGKQEPKKNTANDLLSDMNFDALLSTEDIWSGTTSSIFDNNSKSSLADLEGDALYRAAARQCNEIIKGQCESDAIFTMAVSAYDILITQDCNIYQKGVDQKRLAVENEVRKAGKILRDARLEEYRSHNSSDVNECIAKVKSAITADTACGANYKKCLDYTGAYINVNTGEPIYSPRLFNLTSQIVLPEGDDILGANTQFDNFLESKKVFATDALDTCQGIARTVWEEFKRSAIIEISQAQEEKLEEVRMSCVSTIAECYDTQTGALNSFDTTGLGATSALSASAAKAMCEDKVVACAALFSDENSVECIVNETTGKVDNASTCGLQALLTYVDSVDTVRIAQGCEESLSNFLVETCTDPVYGYPWGCRSLQMGTSADAGTERTLWGIINSRRDLYCGDANLYGVDSTINQMINQNLASLVEDVTWELQALFSQQCQDAGGVWNMNTTGSVEAVGADFEEKLTMAREEKFYQNVFATSSEGSMAQNSFSYGVCLQNSMEYYCNLQNEAMGENGYTTYDKATGRCSFTDKWYKQHCGYIGGIWTGEVCLR